MAVRTSAGVIIIDESGKFVVGFPTNGEFWDLPKGGVDEGETDFQGAIREVLEETGIDLSQYPEEAFEDLGCFRYNQKKRLHLFLIRVPGEIDSSKLVCKSRVEKGTHSYPEMSHFDKISFSEILGKMAPSMIKWFKTNTNFLKGL